MRAPGDAVWIVKRELIRARDRVRRVAAEVLRFLLREVPALPSYRREIFVDGTRSVLLVVEDAKMNVFPFNFNSRSPFIVRASSWAQCSLGSTSRGFGNAIIFRGATHFHFTSTAACDARTTTRCLLCDISSEPEIGPAEAFRVPLSVSAPSLV